MKLRAWMAFTLAAVMVVSLLAGCANDSSPTSGDEGGEGGSKAAVNGSGMPIVADKINLKITAGKAPTTAPDWKQTMLWQEYEKMSNIHVEWEMIPFDSLTEKRNIMLAGGDYPDAFFTAQIPTADLLKYGSQGVFVKLNDLIDEYAPNLKAIMEKYPEVKKGMTMPDGNIYGFPMILDPEFTSVLAGGKMWIKKDWLDKLNLKEPETTEEFYEVLKAFKERDPNGNGEQDEIPFEGVGLGAFISYINGAWGLSNRGVRNANVDVDPGTDKLRFIPVDPKYKEMLQYVRKLYEEELIAKDIFTIQANQYYATGAKGVYGTTITTSPYTLMKQKDYIGLGALKGPHGDQVWSAVGSALSSAGAFAITDRNKHPEATVRWIDHLYSDEGSKMFFMGFEGKSYEIDPSGEIAYTKEITENPDGLTFEQALVKYVVWPGGGYPNIVRQKFFKGAESQPEAIEAAKRFANQFPEEIWPAFNLTVEENDQMATLGADINSYVAEMQAKFVSGKASFDEWDRYVETLAKMGLDQYMEIYQSAYERYKQG
ncbi:extracellular solute-binding protein [Paenibacillus mendelii]|uniref:Extracellular solute-binding protein n=1 Tax=Paenibacillus mendelii TaxID=206163 RepID=A0ABV6J6J3_9BACL|nr:extracellular solute-binding protein [Paenibacillus mendelii]MCQ6561139.1 extracellular solute-binding protein [Paenibacillus mendelii]